MVQQQQRIVRRRAVEARTGLSRSTIYARMDPESEHFDPDFPRPIKLGNGKNPPVGWIEAEVDAYIALLIERSREVSA
ncbi:helix-turn-helix transcriptional regulator [Rhodocyclaceae bacterium SMB388]